MEKEVTVSSIGADEAASFLAGIEKLDPSGRLDAQGLRELAERGQCFAVRGQGVQAVYVLKIGQGVAWVNAGKGSGPVDLVGMLNAIIGHQAQGLDAIAFQTARPGLVRKAKKHGFRVTGWVMRKELK